MTDLETVNWMLAAIRGCSATDIHRYFSPALRLFRFLPKEERRDCASAFHLWALTRATSEPLKLCYANFLRGMDHFRDEEHEAALQVLSAARTDFEALHDPEGQGLCSMLIGATYRTLGHFDLALKVLWEGYGLLQQSGRYPMFVAAAANSMANINLDMHNYDEALAMFGVTRDESAKADDFYFGIYALHGLGKVYLHREQRTEAREVFEKALALADSHKSPTHIAGSMTELADLHVRSGELARAEALNREALAIREQHHLIGGAVTNCMHLGEIYVRQSRWSEALDVLTKALATAEQSRVKLKMYQVHQHLSRLHESLGDTKTSLFHFKRFHELRDQVEQEDSVRKLADAKLIFEAEQTRKENVVIKEQKAEIHSKNVKLQETIDELTLTRISRKARTVTLILAIILFIFQDAILGFALRLMSSDNYVLSLLVKMGIIFSLSPINRAIEQYLLKKVIRKQKGGEMAAAQATLGIAG